MFNEGNLLTRGQTVNNVPIKKTTPLILKAGQPLLKRVELYDHFEGKKIQSDKKSLTFALSFQSKDKTLSDDEVSPLFETIVQTLKTELDASLRE